MFDSKVAVVTGGASGVGLALTRQLLDAGAKVAVVDRDAPSLDRALDGLDRSRVLALQADVALEADVQRCADATVEKWGRIDLFHNNAAIVGPQSSLLDFRMADFDRIFAVNVRGMLLGMQAVGKVMRAQGGGSIVNTSSVSGQRSSRAEAGLGVYGASKAAVIRMTQQAALEFAPHDIRINVICPGADRHASAAQHLSRGWANRRAGGSGAETALPEPAAATGRNGAGGGEPGVLVVGAAGEFHHGWGLQRRWRPDRLTLEGLIGRR
ncbi:NAD(P)-dependent dehydrogenase (short-subunit alcohol dehydrogenase family) [Variovorax soli]|uniref:NAD(P)-dependent dehydrogenase (Short-subunit alcohol dehydrogenase family) n=1 Tax=Variovorax soli TaxID=376815 RepID=A0ABU1NJ81_9BURK|nr:SDR family NAD(P)-dependent oxidoreductase [Variovorax soli]MDR6538512.1 NAD(P)-dependent dehydrogenase (short-subunit alcohol dehydrogenase family) [Variovorax soli]